MPILVPKPAPNLLGLNPQHPLAAGLVAAWPGLTIEDDWRRDVVGRYHLPADSPYAPDPKLVDPLLGLYSPIYGSGVYNLEGLASDDPLVAPDEITIAAWLRTSQVLGSYDGIICNWPGGGPASWTMGTSGSSYLSFQVYDGGSRFAALSTKYEDGEWHLLVGTAKVNGYVRCYLDGDKDFAEWGTLGGSIGTGPATVVRMGNWRDLDGANSFDGEIGPAFAWTRELSAAEVVRLYQDPFGVITKPTRVLVALPPASGVTGTGDGTGEAGTGDGTGSLAITGTGDGTGAAGTGDATGELEIAAAGDGTAEPGTGEATGALEITGTGDGTAAAATADAAGQVGDDVSGAGDGTGEPGTGEATGALEITGTGDGTGAAGMGDAAGQVDVAGTGDGTGAAGTGDCVGLVDVGGSGDGTGTAGTADATGITGEAPFAPDPVDEARLSDALAFVARFEGESITYHVGGVGGTSVTRFAVVQRGVTMTDGSDPFETRRGRVSIWITNRASDGVAEVDPYRDQVELLAALDDDSPTLYRVAQILEQGAGGWKLELLR